MIATVLATALWFLAVPIAVQDTPPAVATTESPLQAIFMEVSGKVRWRADDRSDWRDAVVNDLVSPGAEIRTGLKGRAALRVGRNASVLIDAGTTFQIPRIVRDGDTLRTLAAVKTGRVDFKVDKVGFANDFKVLTPQTTLSVRGTGFGVSAGPLAGVEVLGARTNQIDAIELRYVTQNVRYFLSGAAASSSSRKDPVANAWLSTVGPPQVAGTLVDSSQLEQTVAQGQTGNAPTSAQMMQQIAAARSEAQLGESVEDLLRMEVRAADRSDLATGAVLTAAVSADAAARAARDGALARNESIAAVATGASDLEDAWTRSGAGTSQQPTGAQTRLEAIRTQGDADLQRVAARRSDLEAAIDVGSESGVTGALDAIASIDAAWQGALKSEVSTVIARLQALHARISDAADLAESRDTTLFNALLPAAESEVNATRAVAVTLDSLRDAVARYRQAVVLAVFADGVSETTAAQLVRSIEILREVDRRTAAALAATAAAGDLLDSARSLSERVLLASVFTARIRSGVIESLGQELRSDIDARIVSIELARFDAFYRSAEAGLDAIEEGVDLAQAQATSVATVTDQVPINFEQVRPLLLSARNEADDMNAHWTGLGSQDIAPKQRMADLEKGAADDRAETNTLLTRLIESVDVGDRSGATLFLEDMQVIHDRWWADGTGLLSEAREIDSGMQQRLAAVEAKWTAADTSFQRDVEALLASAETGRAAAAAAVARVDQLKARVTQYQTQYLALAEAGRGGAGAAAQVQTGIAALEQLAESIESARAASAAAAARVATANSNVDRVLYAAVSGAHLRSVNQRAESAAMLASIESSAFGIAADFADGTDRLADGSSPPK